MENEQERSSKHRFGLIGRDISYSFSQGYFAEKFEKLGLHDHSYENFDIPNIADFLSLTNQSDIIGFNVTIPYKEAIIPHLDRLSKKAKKIGAVNTIKRTKKGRLKGYNTDCYGFKKSLKKHLKPSHTHALILGTGGASKAVAFVLEELQISYKFVSRSPRENGLIYKQLDQYLLSTHTLIINCTPLGTFPDIERCPDIPYEFIGKNHLLYDLIYNPSETTFLSKGRVNGASTCNGLRMLELQAEKAWKIWNS